MILLNILYVEGKAMCPFSAMRFLSFFKRLIITLFEKQESFTFYHRRLELKSKFFSTSHLDV